MSLDKLLIMEKHLSQAELEEMVLLCVEAVRAKPDPKGLSDIERTIALVYGFELEVCNGGIDQFFVNPMGDQWAETLNALREIGASRLTSIYERALEVFPQCKPSPDQIVRSIQLQRAGEKARALLWELTTEYISLYEESPGEDAYARIAAYLIKKGFCAT